MASVNKVMIIGHLGRDPESRSFQNGGKMVSLRVATSEQWKDKGSGERRERTEWHAVSILNEGLAGIAERYLRKGSKVYIEGRLQTRKWQDQQGNDRYSTEIVLQGFHAQLVLLDGADRRGGGAQGGGSDSGSAGIWGDGGGTSGGSRSDPFDPGDLDDDVPF